MKNIEAAVYYFPNYHPSDRRNARWHGANWSEWDLMKAARPRFPGHAQPKVPLWGYEDESDPQAMAKKIDAAADHGINAFIFDWYWYEDGAFLEQALEKGFLLAPNNHRLKFSLMWANHDWTDIHPANRNPPYNVLAKGLVSPAAFRAATDHVIGTYFCHPSYWRVNGGLYFSFYQLSALIQCFGSVTATRVALDDFRTRVRAAGLGEVHLNAIVWGRQILPGEKPVEDVNALLDELGFDSISSYVWVHHQEFTGFPTTPYSTYRESNVSDWSKFSARYRLPYFPNVTMGWDPSPRTVQSSRFDNLGYPYTPILAGNTPAEFRRAIEQVRDFLGQPGRNQGWPPIFTINAWNEWTEGSYLEPDIETRYGYLEAIRDGLKIPQLAESRMIR